VADSGQKGKILEGLRPSGTLWVTSRRAGDRV